MSIVRLVAIVVVVAAGAAGCRRTIPAPEKTARAFVDLALAQELQPLATRGERLYELLDRDTRSLLDNTATDLGQFLGANAKVAPGTLVASHGPRPGPEVTGIRLLTTTGLEEEEGSLCQVEVRFETTRTIMDLVYQDEKWRVLLQRPNAVAGGSR